MPSRGRPRRRISARTPPLEGPETLAERARELVIAGEHKAALKLLKPARQRFPRDAVLALREGDALQFDRRFTKAIKAYETALDLDDSLVDAWYGMGAAHLTLRRYGAARADLAQAVARAPDRAAARYNLAQVLFELGCVEEAVAHFRLVRQCEIPELAKLAQESLACVIPGAASADHADVLAERRRYLDAVPASGPFSPKPAPPAERRLKIGYISAFFGRANWMKPVFGAINRHDRDRVQIHMISDADPPSAAAGYRDWPDDHVHDVRGASNDRLTEIIRGLGLDVLVDLNGYSSMRRMPLMAQRLAPVMLGWFNYFATSGSGQMDALLGDAAVFGDATEGAGYVERRIALPGSYLAFDVAYPVPDVAPPPCTQGDPVTFGCLGSQYKLDDAVLMSWAKILARAPHARLFIKNATLDDGTTRVELKQRLRALGVEPKRVSLEGPDDHFDFLAAYANVDIALDTFPYNGGTTTTEALWQGVPVLTFDGDRWAGRTSKSILLAAGLADWVAPGLYGYVRRAIELANNPSTPARLALLRDGLREQLRASAACDVAGLARALEAVYEAEVTAAAGRQPAGRSRLP